MRWTDLPPQLEVGSLATLRAELGSRGVALDVDRARVLLEPAALDQALRSIDGHVVEQGGLLVGRFYGEAIGHADEAAAAAAGACHLVHITGAVPGAGAEASVVSLRLPASSWNAARAVQESGECVVGWYHSHPGFGAFFSETDRATQAAFFREPWHLGWVIDPLRREQAWFSGPSSIRLDEADLVLLPRSGRPDAAAR